MRKLLAGTALAAGVAAFSFASHAAPAAFRLTSPEVAEGKMMATEQILNGFGCTGGNVSPEHAGEGFAYGGMPVAPGLSMSDYAALLQAQAQMFGPFSESGMYGRSAGAGPSSATRSCRPRPVAPRN